MTEYEVSFIVPVYNEEERVERFLKSLENQELTPEIVLIDGGSTDRTVDFIKGYSEDHENVKLYLEKGENRSPAHARNLGLEKSTGKYIDFVDVDVEFGSDYAKKIARAFEENPEADVVKFQNDFIVPKFKNWIHKAFFYRTGALGGYPSKAIKKEFLEEVGGFNEDLGFGEDRLFGKKINSKGKVVRVNESVRSSRTMSIMKLEDVVERYLWYGRTIPFYLKKAGDRETLLGYTLNILSIPFVFLFIVPFIRAALNTAKAVKWSRDPRMFLYFLLIEPLIWTATLFGFYEYLFGRRVRGR